MVVGKDPDIILLVDGADSPRTSGSKTVIVLAVSIS